MEHSGRRPDVDIGSRIDGFVAHVASFREIEVLDLGRKIQGQAREQMQKAEREYLLRQQLSAILLDWSSVWQVTRVSTPYFRCCDS